MIAIKIIFALLMINTPAFALAPTPIDDANDFVRITAFQYSATEPAPGKHTLPDPKIKHEREYRGAIFAALPDANKGMLTFRHRFIITPSRGDADLFLYIGPLDYAMAVYLNGKKIGQVGINAPGHNSALFSVTQVLLPGFLLNPPGKENILALQILPDRLKSTLADIALGSHAAVSWKAFFRNLFNLYLIQASVVFAGFMFIFGLFYFIAYKFSAPKYFYFGVFSLMYGLGYVHFLLNHDAFPELAIMKIARPAVICCSAFLTIFLMHFTHVLHTRLWLHIALAAISLVSFPLTLMQNDIAGVNRIFDLFSTIIISPLLVFNIGLLITALVKHRQWKFIILLISIGLIVGAGLRDIYYVQNGLLPYCWLVSHTYLLLLITVFLLLAFEQASLYLGSRESTRLIEGSNQTLKAASQKIQLHVDILAGTAGSLDTAAAYLRDGSRSMQKETDHVLENTQLISTAVIEISGHAYETSNNLGLISTNVEEMSAAIQEIVKNTGHARSITSEAVEISLNADAKMKQFEDSVNAIGDIVSIVNKIANHIKLVSLNATIEAARAGKYGRAFAVVAQEVKRLAGDTEKSIGSIQTIMKNILDSSLASIADINSIRGSIEKTHTIMDSIAASINQQAEITDYIVNTVNQAVEKSQVMASQLETSAMSVQEITDNMGVLKVKTTELGGVSMQITDHANELKGMIDQLKDVMRGK